MNSLLRSDLTPCTWNTEIKSDSIVNSFRSKIAVHPLRTSSLHQLFLLGSEFESRWISNFFRPLFVHVVHITIMILSSMMCFSTDEMKFYNAFEEHGVKRGVHHNYLWGSLSRLLCLLEKTINFVATAHILFVISHLRDAQPLQTEVETLYLI